MNLSDLNYELPTELIAKTPIRPSRILFSKDGVTEEIDKENLFKYLYESFKPHKRKLNRAINDEDLDRLTKINWNVS